MRGHALRQFYRQTGPAATEVVARGRTLGPELVRGVASVAELHSVPESQYWKVASAAGLASAAVLAATCAVASQQEGTAHCAAEVPLTSANPKADQFLTEFNKWLQQCGCDAAAIEVKPCKENPAAGVGVYVSEAGLKEKWRQSWWQWATSWLRTQDVVLASFPLDSIVTAKSITADEKLGPVYKQLLSSGAIDERQLIMLFLIVERIRGPDSRWQPWISMLPQAFSTPLFFGKADMEEIEGTTLHHATSVLKSSLREQWQAEVGRAAAMLLQSAGTATQSISATFEDFQWAYAVFWSRSITFPEPNNCPAESSVVGQPREGIVPGLDFCNHHPEAHCRWSVWNPASSQGKTPEAVALVTSRKSKLKPGGEITINYGDKGNEELFMQYGFTLERNPHDTLMVVCPLPPAAEWDDGFHAKMKLLLAKGLAPQLFLTAAEQKTAPRGSKGATDNLGLSEATWETLEVLVMDPKQAVVASQSLSTLPAEKQETVHLSIRGLRPAEASATRIAKLTTLRRLLEVKVAELEEGTGSLESDIRILEAADSTMPPTLWSCLVYRASQKRLARGFLERAEKALVDEMMHGQTLEKKRTEQQT